MCGSGMSLLCESVCVGGEKEQIGWRLYMFPRFFPSGSTDIHTPTTGTDGKRGSSVHKIKENIG